jgi:hypothetical protein
MQGGSHGGGHGHQPGGHGVGPDPSEPYVLLIRPTLLQIQAGQAAGAAPLTALEIFQAGVKLLTPAPVTTTTTATT